jgi:hypothetical protein
MTAITARSHGIFRIEPPGSAPILARQMASRTSERSSARNAAALSETGHDDLAHSLETIELETGTGISKNWSRN